MHVSPRQQAAGRGAGAAAGGDVGGGDAMSDCDCDLIACERWTMMDVRVQARRRGGL